MFDDILWQEENSYPSYPINIEVNYFKDGEGYEYDVTLTEKELLGGLPLFLPLPIEEDKLKLFVEKIKLLLIANKCLQSFSYMV